jgi:hypothetical protein
MSLGGFGENTSLGGAIEVQLGIGDLMPAGQPHALKALKPFKMVLTMIRP